MNLRTMTAAVLLAVLHSPAYGAFAYLGILGDSLSDTGRLAQATGEATFGLLSVPKEPYLPGRFSNGPVWVDYYATEHPGITIGNAAMGGAFSGLINGRDNAGDDLLVAVPFIGGSLRAAASGLNSQLPLVPDLTGSNAAFVLWIGANDINSALDIGFAAPQDVVPTSLNNVGNAINTLLARGVNDIFVGNLPDLCRTPDGLSSGRATDLTAATIDFNNGLAILVAGAGAKVHLVDLFTPFNALLANAGALGFTDITTPCVDDLLDTTACANPDAHLFWDTIHPSTAIHREIAGVFTASFEASPIPLPASWLLLLPAAGCLFVRRRSLHAGRVRGPSPAAASKKC